VAPSLPKPIAPDKPEELLVFTNDLARYTFSSHGGGIKLVELLKYKQRVGCRDKTGTNSLASLNADTPLPILSLAANEALQGDGLFKLSRTDTGVRAEKTLENGLVLVKEFQPTSNYLVNATTTIENRSAQAVSLPVQEWNVGSATPMDESDNEQFIGILWYDGSSKQAIDQGWFANRFLGCFPGTPRTQYVGGENNVVWAEVHNQFFTVVLMPAQPANKVTATKIDLPPPPREVLAENPRANLKPFGFQSSVVYAATNLAPGQVLGRKFMLYAGPKENRILERIALQLKNDIDIVMGYTGFFGWFSKALLWSMNGLHELGLGYAMAIIVITVIIKLLFWPLTQASTRSMKRMASLQPQMNAIRERYKDDPTKMNRKMMDFMKEHKVSPLGGCLPMLLQIPVFIGFFTMVRSAIELRGARFLWACDLSKPDTLFFIPVLNFPFNPLPLLMGATMLWQARLTPASPGMDPAQQKIMRYMPLIFLFILYNYSSGLTLYWTVQNLLTIAQTKLTRAKDEAAKAPNVGPPKKQK
jgi:YidC/Oxa1 family membrane protein insertase